MVHVRMLTDASGHVVSCSWPLAFLDAEVAG